MDSQTTGIATVPHNVFTLLAVPRTFGLLPSEALALKTFVLTNPWLNSHLLRKLIYSHEFRTWVCPAGG